MNDTPATFETLNLLLIFACLGSGMMAGLFVAFSTFMMKALGSLAPAEGIRAMQAINRFIVRPSFVLVFFGTAVLLAIAGYRSLGQPGAAFVLAAAAGYILACLLSTMAFNVPLNDRLEACDPGTAAGQALWRHYLRVWTRWNHVRSAACVASTLLIALALGEQ